MSITEGGYPSFNLIYNLLSVATCLQICLGLILVQKYLLIIKLQDSKFLFLRKKYIIEPILFRFKTFADLKVRPFEILASDYSSGVGAW